MSSFREYAGEIAFGELMDRAPFTNTEIIERLQEFEKKAWLWDSFIESLDEEVEEEWELKAKMENWRGE
tara:strand:+ start:496 stop:702 length:207 start_codon:yes stop_codon:yes gene_type:complete